MDVKLLFLTVVLLSSPLLTLCDPLYVLSAPNLLRVGSSENVFVEAQDYSGAALDVKIIVTNLKKNLEILSKSVRLTADNNFQILTEIKIPDDQQYFSDDPLEKQYVYLQAQFPSTTLEKVVMISFQSGYIFVQTDKPIYTPASTVQYRIFSLMPNMKPLSQSGIKVEIMNPQGITVSSEKIFPVKGMKSGEYAIPEFASSGIWKVVTQFTNTPQKTFTADFEVKQYVLPVFEVKLKPSKSFFYVDDQSLTVDIEAKYLFGQKVDGNAFVVFGVMNGEKKIRIPTSLQKVQILKGAGTAELTNQMITETFLNISQLVGRSIWFSVSVLTESGSEMVEAERRGIQIVTSSYTIHFKKTPQFFKPGMPFEVSIYVTNPDQTPAENVEVEINPGGVKGRTRANGIAKATVNTLGGSSTLEITAKTKYRQLSDEQQAVKKMTAQAYIPKDGSDNYLHIFSDAAELQIGDQMKVFLNTGQSPGVKDQDYTYMILSKGQILKVDRFKRRGQSLVSLPVPVTIDMVPSFRFVAYYHVGSSEVVSDSVWVDVKDTCMGTFQVKVKDKMYSYGTGDEVKLQITGDPGAKVGLVVVDKAVNVLNKNRLTQTQIWDVIEKHDIGCTAGGGRDSMGVFTDAGLMFESSTAGGTNTRTMPNCPFLSKRKRRSLDDDKYYTDFEMIVSRTNIPENWLWEEIDLPTCRENHCGTSVTDKVIYLKQSITTRQIVAVSLSPTHGICVAEPEEMVVFKTLFIDLKMPYSAVRGEQLEIKAIIHNYSQKKLKVRVEFMETENVCSSASKKGKYRTIVNVDKDSSIAVSYVIIPMTLGNHIIEVKASAYDSVHTDGVKKPLKVVSEGVLVPLHSQNVELNPAKNGENPLVFKADIPADRLPDTPANTYISITDKLIESGSGGDAAVRMGYIASNHSVSLQRVKTGKTLDFLIMKPLPINVNRSGPQAQSRHQTDGNAGKCRGSRCLVLITVCFQIICVLLLINNILQHITIRAERDLIKSYKNTVEELNQTINSLQDNYTDLMTEKHQLQNNFISLTQKNLETRVRDLTAEKHQLIVRDRQLITRVRDLTAEKKQLQRDFEYLNKKGPVCFFMSTDAKNWSDSRQYCRDRGADLVIINTEEKQRLIHSLVSERVWIGLSDIQQEGIMKWVDNSTLKQGFWLKDEPNDDLGNEDCIELNYNRVKLGWSPLKSWNDHMCSEKKKGICEK